MWCFPAGVTACETVQYIPAFLPGGRFRGYAKEAKKVVQTMSTVPYDYTLKQRVCPSCHLTGAYV
jgi:hypothetical protein